MLKYFQKAFGLNGDKTAVPDNTQPDGTVSYDSGYGFDYERDPTPGVDPLAKDIERDKMNQILFDITSNVKQFQDYGAPEWNATRAAVGYSRDARVTFSNVVYTSTADGNTQTPPNAPWIIGGETDPTIIAIAALSPAANTYIYFTATDVAATAAITSFGRAVNAAVDAAAGRVVLGIDTANITTEGIQRQATDSEIGSGADVAATVTPRQLRLGFSANPNPSSGHFTLPSWLGGYGFKWRKIAIGTSGSGYSVIWDAPFATNMFITGIQYADGGNSASCWLAGDIGLTGVTAIQGSSATRTMRVWAFGN